MYDAPSHPPSEVDAKDPMQDPPMEQQSGGDVETAESGEGEAGTM